MIPVITIISKLEATLTLVRYFSISKTVNKENLKNAKKFNSSSQKWLLRQINDKFVKQAKLEHHRCRSAFKLLEINKSYKIFKPGQTVVDLGCAPGSWTQVAVEATMAKIPNSDSLVVGIDLSPIHPIEGATLLSALDFTTESAQQQVMAALNGRRVDVVMSDMAPTVSGIKFMDHTNIIKLCYSALIFARKTSSPGATLIMKLFDGGESKQLMEDAKKSYEAIRVVRPEASRKDSSELYYVCLRFKCEQEPIEESESVENSKRTLLEKKKG